MSTSPDRAASPSPGGLPTTADTRDPVLRDRTVIVRARTLQRTIKRLPTCKRFRVAVQARNAIGWGKKSFTDYFHPRGPTG